MSELEMKKYLYSKLLARLAACSTKTIWPKQAMLTKVLSVVAVAAALAAAMPAAAGGACHKTGGNSNSLIWTGSGYTCAYVSSSGTKELPGLGTGFWTADTPTGYSKKSSCTAQTGSVEITYIYTAYAAGLNLGSSITFSGFNKATGDRHWGAGVLWNTADGGTADSSQYNSNCATDYSSIDANLVHMTTIDLSYDTLNITAGEQAVFTVKVTAPDGGGTPQGKTTFFQQKGDSQNPTTKDCSGTIKKGDPVIGQVTLDSATATFSTPKNLHPGEHVIYAVYGGWPVTSNGLPAYCIAPPGGSGLTPSLSTSVTLTVNQKEAQQRQYRVGKHIGKEIEKAAKPIGTQPIPID